MRIFIFLSMLAATMLTALFGIFCALAVADAIEGGNDRFFGIFLFTPPTVILVFLSKYLKEKHEQIIHKEVRSYILKFALQNQGLITATELASDGKLSIETSRKHLERMYVEGICDKRITDSFINIYGFSEVLSAEEKSSSKSISDF